MMQTILDGNPHSVAHEQPYKYAVLPNALPDDLYAELLEARPAWEDIMKVAGKTGSNIRADIGSAQYKNWILMLRRHMPQVWRDFLAAHTTERFFFQVCHLLHAEPVFLDMEYEFVPRGRRPETDLPRIDMDCQIGVNSPNTGPPERVRGPHVDNPIELWGGMLYMPIPGDEAGGDLIVYKSLIPHKELRFIGKAELPDDVCEEVDRVPYAPNTAVFFENGIHCIHGVSPRDTTDHPRQLVNFIAEWPQAMFKLAR